MRGRPFGPGISLNDFGAGEVSSLQEALALRGAKEESKLFLTAENIKVHVEYHQQKTDLC